MKAIAKPLPHVGGKGLERALGGESGRVRCMHRTTLHGSSGWQTYPY
jgi:hypothetical protein